MSCIYHSIKTEVERLEKHRNVVCTTFTDQSEQKCCSWVKMQFRRAVNKQTVHKNIFTASYPLIVCPSVFGKSTIIFYGSLLVK